MDQSLQQKLIDSFSFLQSNSNNRDNIFQTQGFQCGNGWYDLLFSLFTDIELLYRDQHIDSNTLQIVQVKSKLGGLRIYVSSPIEGIRELIVTYQEKSEHTCEDCGDSGKIVHIHPRWLRCICEYCAQKYKN